LVAATEVNRTIDMIIEAIGEVRRREEPIKEIKPTHP
jgi:hypothetical protein